MSEKNSTPAEILVDNLMYANGQLRKALRMQYLGHRPPCTYGVPGPEGDYCTCDIAERKQAYREALRL